jgi:hypothetical protein
MKTAGIFGIKRWNISKKKLMSSKNKNMRDLYRGINEFKRDHQHRSNLVKDENSDLLANSHNNLNRWKNYFCQILNVHSCQCIVMLGR